MCITPIQAQDALDELPSMAFLEYLAEMTEIDGKLVGPQDLPIINCKKNGLKRDENKNDSSNGHTEKAPKDDKPLLAQECIDND
jgi:hypothetical protein